MGATEETSMSNRASRAEESGEDLKTCTEGTDVSTSAAMVSFSSCLSHAGPNNAKVNTWQCLSLAS